MFAAIALAKNGRSTICLDAAARCPYLRLAIGRSTDDNPREMSGIFFDDPGVRF